MIRCICYVEYRIVVELMELLFYCYDCSTSLFVLHDYMWCHTSVNLLFSSESASISIIYLVLFNLKKTHL